MGARPTLVVARQRGAVLVPAGRGSVQEELRLEQLAGEDVALAQADEPFDVEFRRGALPVADMEPDFDALGGDDPEPIEHGLIKVGRLLCEIVASAVDPFPRADDATLDQHEAGAAEAATHPFAALARLKGDETPN